MCRKRTAAFCWPLLLSLDFLLFFFFILSCLVSFFFFLCDSMFQFCRCQRRAQCSLVLCWRCVRACVHDHHYMQRDRKPFCAWLSYGQIVSLTRTIINWLGVCCCCRGSELRVLRRSIHIGGGQAKTNICWWSMARRGIELGGHESTKQEYYYLLKCALFLFSFGGSFRIVRWFRVISWIAHEQFSRIILRTLIRIHECWEAAQWTA